MTYRKLFIPAIALCAVIALFSQCKKNDKATTSTVTTTINIDTSTNVVSIANIDSSSFALPTAFTPNGDGRNDLYRAFFTNPAKISSYFLSVYKPDGTLVFQTDSLRGSWDGRVNGVLDTDYKYAVHVALTTVSGAKLDTSSYLFLLTNNPTSDCVNDVVADKPSYIFEDQMDATGGHPYPTSENFCN